MIRPYVFILLGPAALISCLSCRPISPQSRTITASFFSDPDSALDIDTPAFKRRRGFTRHRELLAFLDTEVRASEGRARLESLGRSQRGRDIPIVFLSSTATVGQPLRIWLQGGLHGNEPAGTEGLLLLLRELLKTAEHRALFSAIELAIVPMANVDGYERQIRPANDGLDLNRDQTKLLALESRLLREAFNAFAPDVAVDFHEYRPFRRDFIHLGRRGITSIYDVMFLYSGNLNVPPSLRAFTANTFVAEAKAEMNKRGLRARDYITTRRIHGEVHFNQGAVSARSSATSFALANAISTLIEVRGVGVGRAGFRRRVLATYWTALQHLRSAATHADAIRRVLKQARADKTPITVLSERTTERQTIQAIDVSSEEAINVDVVVHNALKSTPLLTRRQPFAYLILPTGAELAERLRILGVRCHVLRGNRTLKVESYRVNFSEEAPLPYEGTYLQTVRTTVVPKEVTFPAGTFIVRMDQRRAKLAAEVLEPEAANGFVSFGVLKVRERDELPVYRGMTAFSID